MTMKLPHKIGNLSDDGAAAKLNESLTRVYAIKVESRYHFDASSTASIPHVYQSMESGMAGFSSNGSPTVVKTFSFGERHDTILAAFAHAMISGVIATVIDVTQSQLSISAYGVTATANLSAVTTSSFSVSWLVLGADP